MTMPEAIRRPTASLLDRNCVKPDLRGPRESLVAFNCISRRASVSIAACTAVSVVEASIPFLDRPIAADIHNVATLPEV